MHTRLIVLALLGTTGFTRAQELVDNPSFEQMSSCPLTAASLSLAEPWFPPTLGTSDYFHECNTDPSSVSVPVNAVGNQAAFHGSGYAAFIALSPPTGFNPDYREYVQSPLLGTLEAGKTYRFSMELSLAEDSSAATDRVGAYFSPTAVGSSDDLPLPFTPQLETPAGTFLTDIIEWIPFEDTFVAAGGEQHITIGNFHDASSSATTPAGLGPDPPLQVGTAYYYLDAVSLQCEPCYDAPDHMIGWWPLDETGGTTAYDIVGAQHGLHVDAPVPMPGYVDFSLDFFASAVTVATTTPLEYGTSDLSIDAWVRPGALGTAQALFVKMPAPPTGPGYAIALNADGTVRFLMVDAALNLVTADSTAALAVGEWSHVTVVVDRDDPSGGRIHVDDDMTTFDPTSAPGSLANTLPLLFGRDGGAGIGADLIGTLDEVEFYTDVLTLSEVLALYQSRTSGKCKTLLEIGPVTPIPVPTPTIPTIGTSGNLTNGTGVSGTFTLSAKADPPGTKCGHFTSTVALPVPPTIVTPQPLQVPAGESAPVDIRLTAPRRLRPGDVACYSITTTHVETGRTFLSRAVVVGRPLWGEPPPLEPGLRDHRR